MHGYAPWAPNAEIHGNQRNTDDRELIEAVVVANSVLQALSAGDAPITLSELARKLQLTIPRVYRQLMTLTAMGLVEKTGDALRYPLGWQIVITKRREEPSATFPSLVADSLCTGAYTRKGCRSRRYQTISILEQWTRAPDIVFVRRRRAASLL